MDSHTVRRGLAGSALRRFTPLVAVPLLFPLVAACESSGATAPQEPDTLVLDVRVHLLTSPDSEALTTTFSEEEVIPLFQEVNRVWDQAGIEWSVEEVVAVEARNGEEFEAIIRGDAPPDARVFQGAIPADRLSGEAWNVFLIRDLGGFAGGIYFPGLPAVLQPELDPFGVRGVDGALVRILAHELGHALSLPHVPCTGSGNLMAPGCAAGDRTRLAPEQIEAARAQAASGPYQGGAPTF